MSHSSHTYGPTCHLARNVSFESPESDDDIPCIIAQYFYSSPLPIDDPLSVVPIPTGSDSKPTKVPPRPFSASDNNALEEAWMSFGPGKSKKDGKKKAKSKPEHTKESDKYPDEGHWGKSKKGKPEPVKDSDEGHAGKHKKEKPGKRSKATSVAESSTAAASSSATSSYPCHSTGFEDKHHRRHAQAEATAAAKPTKVSTLVTTNTSGSKKPAAPQGSSKNSTVPRNSAPATSKHFKVNKSLAAEKRFKAQSGSVDGSVDSDRESNHSNSECGDLDHVPVEPAEICCDFTQDEGPRESPEAECCDFTRDETLRESSKVAECCDFTKEDARENQPAPNCGYTDDEEDHNTVSYPEQFEILRGGHSQSVKNPNGNKKNSRKSKSSDQAALQGVQIDGTFEGLPKINLPDSVPIDVVPDAPLPIPFPSGRSKRNQASDSSALPIQVGDAGTTGQPFVKFNSRKDGKSQSQTSGHDGSEDVGQQSDSQKAEEAEFQQTEPLEVPGCKAQKTTKEQAHVPVGISRIHLVKLPALQMHPIYWSPVHDIASVTRGTWFYKDTMFPVEPAVANQLEIGYRELRPWSKTWSDELNSALEVGAIGEEKIAHRLWPKDEGPKIALRKKTENHLSTNPYCAARCFNGEAAAEGTLDLDDKPAESNVVAKKYSSAQVIYKDARSAFILKPTLQPSAYYGRKPLQKIKRGMNVGICVVRGFDWKLWDKLHTSKKPQSTKKVVDMAAIAGDVDASKRTACPPCEAQKSQPKVKDLVLVIHGIGQKLSERVESFHFTHAINSFRRCVNMELANEGVQKVLRPDLGGIMVLPVNWRSNLTFEDGGPMKDDDQKNSVPSDFSMKDITPDTIPAVRNMISDVMLDIPFYMSHHKPKMIQAVISEANRVYQLWCKNNPNFHKEGRVHLIAHSLGSAMAVDILSKQPTNVYKTDPLSKKVNTKYFNFNTTNLFLAGSPAAFFLLLEKGKLIPRRGRGKPDADYNDDHDKTLTGESGTYGCMAVDNVYNIMNYNDPIAYRLNATIDAPYATSLKNAQVPSATTGFFESIGKAVRSITPGVSSDDPAVGQVTKPPTMARLPSQLEMEIHDFTREEIAEKRYYLLNDCGQVDWFLSSVGGPLEIQYINMLSAHSSYWLSADFIRMIVTECGRTPGKEHTLPNMRAVKVGHKA